MKDLQVAERERRIARRKGIRTVSLGYPMLFLVMLVCGIVGCQTHSEASRKLDQAEEMMERSPRQIAIILDSLRVQASAWDKEDRMRYELLWASARNKSFQPIGTDTTMVEVVDYYLRHGTPNERMNACYQLGCIYLDMRNYELAGQALYRAIECADTLASDCDYPLLARVYGQLTQVFLHKTSPKAQLSIYPKAERYALMGKDTLLAVDIRKEWARYYWQTENWDSAAILYERCLSDYQRFNDTVYVDLTLKQLAGAYTHKGDHEKATACFALFEQRQISPNGELRLANRQWNYWVLKAQYHMNLHAYQDALPLLYRARDYANPNCQLAASLGLYNLHKEQNRPDSALFYLERYSKIQSEQAASYSEDTLLELQSNFDVRRERERRQESERLANRLLTVLFTICISVVTGGLGCLLFFYYRRNVVLGKAMRSLQIRNRLDELASREASPSEQMAIKQLQRERDQLVQESSVREVIAMRIAGIKASSAYCKLDGLSRTRSEKPTAKDWEGLQSEVEREFTDVAALLERNSIQHKERLVCLMICAGFRPKAMGILLGNSPENISSIRRRLGLKLFGKECRAKEFDQKLLSFKL
ncbi:MAG: hypothetical protein HUJ98_03765 [Bacteroidaceae bacterium]|nr:hypothetical protein [Bacteroidaceae bacterium]